MTSTRSGPTSRLSWPIARFIGGGTRWNMDDHSVWRPLFGTLLAPVYWFTDDPTTVFHSALTLNALLGGIAAALLVYARAPAHADDPVVGCGDCGAGLTCAGKCLLDRLRVLRVARRSALSGHAARSAPAPAIAHARQRARHGAARRRGVRRAQPDVAAHVDHPRRDRLAVVRRRMAFATALPALRWPSPRSYVVSVYTAYVVDRLWDEPSTRNSIGGVREQLVERGARPRVGPGPDLVPPGCQPRRGGLRIRRPGAPRCAPDRRSIRTVFGPTCIDARLVLLVVGACWALSIVFMSDRWRSDQLVYGRYNDSVVMPVLVGRAGCADRRDPAATAAGDRGRHRDRHRRRWGSAVGVALRRVVRQQRDRTDDPGAAAVRHVRHVDRRRQDQRVGRVR